MRRFLAHYGMVLVLALLCAFFSAATLRRDAPTGAGGAGSALARLGALPTGARVALAGRADPEDRAFVAAVNEALTAQGTPPAATAEGDPPTIRAALETAGTLDAIVTTPACRDWPLWSRAFAGVRVVVPEPRTTSTFLTAANFRNIADQIAVIALIAIGMTLVILTGGIDLSVGSLVALSAVTMAWIVQASGGAAASPLVLVGAAVAAMALCGLVGALSGLLVARFKLPPFIATLGAMQVASGLAFMIARGQTLYALPESVTALGRGNTLGLSNAVWLMLLCYGAAHVFLNRAVPGRNLYAVGGNTEAARLAGVSVPATLLLAYVVSGAMAGLGGVVATSQLAAAAPTYGVMYELYVVAAVVVGGTHLSGGSGRILGTLIGAFIIAVIQNGMNLMNLEAYPQKVVLGLVILGAVLAGTLRQRRAEARS